MLELHSDTISHNRFLNNEQVFRGYGCAGDNISPDLSWDNAPDSAKSFALICHDPDAPKENGWYHWLVINMPLSKTAIKKGEKLNAPAFVAKTDFDTFGYGGACPPVGHGVHHYNFTLYALDIEKLDVSPDIKPFELHNLVKSHAIESATITAIYQR